MKTYRYDKDINEIIIDPPMGSKKYTIKVGFYRGEEKPEYPDYPIAYANMSHGAKIYWTNGYEIRNVMIKRKGFLGLFSPWEKLKEKQL